MAKIVNSDEMFVSCEKFRVPMFISYADHIKQMTEIVTNEICKPGEDKSE